MFKNFSMTALLLTCLLAVNAHADGMGGMPMGGDQGDDADETADFCAPTNPDVCAHIHFLSGALNTTTEGQLLLHVDKTPQDQVIQNLKVGLWMEMGSKSHGSAPLAISPDSNGPNMFDISNAWFVMPGTWLVKASFTIGQESFEIDIPVNVAQ